MQRFVWKVVEPFNELRRLISRPQRPTAGETADGNHNKDVQRGANTQGSEGKRRVKASVRQKLDDLSSLRIPRTAIEFIPGGSPKSGGKADVARATYRQGNPVDEQAVAVKKIRYHRDITGGKLDNEFVHEVKVMAGLSHENIAGLIGFVEDLEYGTGWIVLSWEPNGNVSEFLAKGKWEIPERVSLIKDTFEGIKYLHTLKPPICHGDLKSFNILVSSDYRAVITDFGSSRAIHAPEDDVIGDQSHSQAEGLSPAEGASPPIHVNAADNQLTLTGPAWSLRWAAPEVMNGKRPGLSSDIWAAGWICWEVMTDNVPFPELNSAGVITLTVIQGEVPSPREQGQLGQIVALCSLMTDCWAFNPKARPRISRCCNELQWMPSTPPLRAPPSGSKVPSTDLLRTMGEIKFRQANYASAALLFQQALSLAMSTRNQTATADALKWLGGCSRAQSKYDQSEESYTRAQEIYARVCSDPGRADTLLGLGDVYRLQFKSTEAEESYTRAQEIYARLGDDVNRARALDGLGCVYLFQSKYTEAEGLFTRAHEIVTRIGNDLGLASILNGLGYVYRSQSKYTEAEDSYTRAQEICARVGSDMGRANALYGLGHLYRSQSKYTQAEESYNQAQEIYARISDDVSRANALLGLGDLYRQQSRYTEAEEPYTQAQEIFARTGGGWALANALDGLGDVYREQSKYTQAEDSYTRAEEIYTRIGRDLSLSRAIALDGLGRVYRFQSKYTQAEESLARAQEIYALNNNDLRRANALDRLGDVYCFQSKYTEAQESYTRAQEIYARIGDDLGRANTLRGLGDLRREQGRDAEAASHYAQARELYMQLGRTENAQHCLKSVERCVSD